MLKFGLFSVIDPLVRNLERVHPTLPGQPHLGAGRTYSTWLLVRLWLLKVLAGWSQRQLFTQLRKRENRRWLRRFMDLPRPFPDRAHFGRRVRKPEFLCALRLLFEALAERLSRRTPGDGEVLSVDFTDLPVDVKHDPYGAYGYTSKGRFYGYKRHLVVSRRGALVASRNRPAAICAERHVTSPGRGSCTSRKATASPRRHERRTARRHASRRARRITTIAAMYATR
ncbi:MAG: hypothetical protein R6X20_16545 [Phycisphaerae bacterium]